MKNKWTRRQFIKTTAYTVSAAAATLVWEQHLWAARAFQTDVFKRQHYEGLRGLTDYPYFELTEKGLLRLTVDGLEGGIDGHTHFALNALMGGSPDLLKSHPRTLYYLPPDVKTSLNIYANQNYGEEERKQMTSIIIKTILMPGGSSATDTHSIPNLLAEMDLLGIDKAVVFPIRYGLPFGDDMTERYMEAIKNSGKQERFILCGSVKPTLDDAVEKVKEYKAKGLKGIKMHPNSASFYPNDKRAWPAYDACEKHDLPVFIHSGRTGFKEKTTLGMKLYTEDYSDIVNFEAPIEAFPNVRFVLCHSGALQNEGAIGIAKKHKNVWLDIHGQGVNRVRAMIKELGPERLMFGSDWAFYPEGSMLVRMLIATENDNTVRRMLFSENARRFWGY